MKPRFNFTASILVIFLTNAPAATFSWDTLAGDSALTGGDGSWDTSNALWSEDSGISNIAWPSTTSGNDDAVFSDAAGTVNVSSGGITANDISFQTDGYSITGGTLTLNGTSPTILTNGHATIASIIAGSAGLNKSGTSNLTLGGTNTYTGTTTIGAGSLILATGAGLQSSGILSFSGNSSFDLGANSQTLANLSLVTTAASVSGVLSTSS
jgi:fibronectin-binding autotransporter adhesin